MNFFWGGGEAGYRAALLSQLDRCGCHQPATLTKANPSRPNALHKLQVTLPYSHKSDEQSSL